MKGRESQYNPTGLYDFDSTFGSSSVNDFLYSATEQSNFTIIAIRCQKDYNKAV